MIKSTKWTLILALIGGCAIQAAGSSEWGLVEDSSNVRFIGVLEGSAFRGRFENFSAMIDFDPANPTAGKIIGVVQMDTARTGDEERDATLMEADWFNPEQHPESRFESERIEQLDDGTFVAHGHLTMIGVSQPVTMPFEFDVEDSSADFSGDFEIKRLNFGMGWDSTNWIADEVGVQVRLKLQR